MPNREPSLSTAAFTSTAVSVSTASERVARVSGESPSADEAAGLGELCAAGEGRLSCGRNTCETGAESSLKRADKFAASGLRRCRFSFVICNGRKFAGIDTLAGFVDIQV